MCQYSNHFRRCYKSSSTSFRKKLKLKTKQKDRLWKTCKRKWRLLCMSKRSTLPPSVFLEKWAEKVFVELLMLLCRIVILTQMQMVWVLLTCSRTHPLSSKIRMYRWWLQEVKESQFVEDVVENQLSQLIRMIPRISTQKMEKEANVNCDQWRNADYNDGYLKYNRNSFVNSFIKNRSHDSISSFSIRKIPIKFMFLFALISIF